MATVSPTGRTRLMEALASSQREYTLNTLASAKTRHWDQGGTGIKADTADELHRNLTKENRQGRSFHDLPLEEAIEKVNKAAKTSPGSLPDRREVPCSTPRRASRSCRPAWSAGRPGRTSRAMAT